VIDAAVAVAVNLPLVHGIAFHEDQVYLAGSQAVWVADVQDDGSFANLEVVLDTLSDGGQHPRRTIAIGPDDKMYVSLGSSCNACPETNRLNATIIQSNLDGSETQIFASGLRNTLGWAWEPESGLMWGMDQGSDWRGDEQPPEELNQIVAGGNYGWPYCFGDQEVDPFLAMPPAGASPEQYCANTFGPALTYQAHSSPISFIFYAADQFPAEYQGDAFITMRGSWNRGEPTGYKVVRLQFEDGQPVGFEDFVTGWLMDDGQSHFGRVAGLTTAPDGSLLVSDDTNGVIYRISYAE
jgi:glucose/arabinose dehydrogenase